MSKIKRLITISIPNQKCNLQCEYCYISQLKAWESPKRALYDSGHIAKCLSLQRLGGPCLINFTGNGETLLQPDIVEIVAALLAEGHYIEIVTNGTITKKINKLLELPTAFLAHLEFKISFHYKELNRLSILDDFFSNVRHIRTAGASFSLELMAHDGIEGDIDSIEEVCLKNIGAVCQATIGRNEHTMKRTLLTEHSKEEFRAIWKTLDSPMMRMKFELLDKKRREFCYAGAWSLHINLYTGEAQQCYWLPVNQNVFENPNEPILFLPVGHTCPQPFCINGHAHIALGVIPELEAPTYCDMRNRHCQDGGEWFTPECREFFSSKLVESNAEFSGAQKVFQTCVQPFRLLFWMLQDKNTATRIKKLVHRYLINQ